MLKLNKPNLILFASLLLGAVLFVSAMQQADLGNIQAVFRNFPWYMMVFLCLLNAAAAIVMSGARWQAVLRAQGVRMSFMKVLEAKLVGYVVNYITPAAILGGEPVRAYMVNVETGAGWKKSLATVVIEELIFFGVLFAVLALSFFVMLDKFSFSLWITVPALLFVGLILTLMLKLYARAASRNGSGENLALFTLLLKKMRFHRVAWIKQHMRAFEETDLLIENFFRKHRRAFQWAVFFSAVEFVFYVLLALAICWLLGSRIDFLGALQIFSLTTLANMAPIPAALGVFEMILTLAFELLGLSKQAGFAFSLLMRGTNVAVCLVGLAALITFASRNMSRRMNRGDSTPPVFARLYRFIRK